MPGAIQPHGVLVALGEDTLDIRQVSANAEAYFGVTPAAALGQPLAALLGAPAALAFAGLHSIHTTLGEPMAGEIHGRMFDARAHRHLTSLIIELEPHAPNAAASDNLLRGALARLQRASGMSELCSAAVEETRKLTGFDRVLLYRFDEEGHGDVLEESRADDVDAYRGLRFPASDIPRQARELYRRNWLRLIPDSSYVPVPLVAAIRPEMSEPLDLSFATLRSVSPTHLQYLQNMGVGASMSVSLLRGDTLWGLIACHHREPRHVSFAARAGCEVIGRVASLLIAAQEELESRVLRDTLRGVEATLVDVMRHAHGDIVNALMQRSAALMQLVAAGGVVVSTALGVRSIGVTPAPGQVAALISWLGKQGSSGLFQTDSLSACYAPALDYVDVASGLLALALPGDASWVLWFRPEIIQTVKWAGDPSKDMDVTADGTRLHPRRSFDAWREVVRARSRPWRIAEIDAGENLRRRIIELDLGRQITRAEDAIRLRDDMVAVLSHDLKTPLQVIQLGALLLGERVAGHAQSEEMLQRIQRAATGMNTLIHDLLDLAKIEAGRFEVAALSHAASRLVADVAAILGPLAQTKNIGLRCEAAANIWVQADAERVFQVLSNLVGNALKFTPVGGSVSIDVCSLEGMVQFSVRDTGPGIPSLDLAHVFDRYWQARRAQSIGSGLGLYIAKGIVEAHGGGERAWLWRNISLHTRRG